MLTRTREKTWTFSKPFMLRSLGRELPAGSYRITTDEELIEGLSFPVYRRVATMILVPAQVQHGAMEMVTIDPAELELALERELSGVGMIKGDKPEI
jgi:hypothetical protein